MSDSLEPWHEVVREGPKKGSGTGVLFNPRIPVIPLVPERVALAPSIARTGPSHHDGLKRAIHNWRLGSVT
jgi:hypothetical protein